MECIELHCAGSMEEHQIGDPICSFREDGEGGIESKQD
jgi:hypothetical protein